MNIREYRDSLREQLREIAPLALDGLRERGPFDAVIVLGALQTVTLLDDDTIGSRDRKLREEVLTAWASAVSANTNSLRVLFDQVLWPQSVQPADLDALELSDVLDSYVELAALLPILPPDVANRHRAFLDEVEGDIWATPSAWAPVGDYAAWLTDALDLPTDHPAMRLLQAVVTSSDMSVELVDEAAAYSAFERAERATAQRRARRSVSPSISRTGRVREVQRRRLPRLRGYLVSQRAAPTATLGSVDPTPVQEARFEVGVLAEAPWFGGVIRVRVAEGGALTIIASMSAVLDGPAGIIEACVFGDGALIQSFTLSVDDSRCTQGRVPEEVEALELEVDLVVLGEEV